MTPRAQRGFLVRAVRYLAADAGIRQFLDIGTGLPTANNTHHRPSNPALAFDPLLQFAGPLVLTQRAQWGL